MNSEIPEQAAKRRRQVAAGFIPWKTRRKRLITLLERVPFVLMAAFLTLGGMTARAQTEVGKKAAKQPEKRAPATVKGAPSAKSDSMRLIFEFIEVEQPDFSDWLFENPLQTDATKLRAEIQKWSKKKRALIFETLVVHTRSGQRARAKSVEELIYPIEYDSPLLGETPLDRFPGLVMPLAFETRNIGITIEVDPVLGKDRKTVDLSLTSETVKQLEDVVWTRDPKPPRRQVAVPLFFTAKFTTQRTVLPGHHALVGTLRLSEPVKKGRKYPLVLVFVRADLD